MTTLPEPESLQDLQSLDRALLHIFVAGPGRGETVAVAFPRRDWLLVDGCRTSSRVHQGVVVEAIIDRWASRSEERVAYAITHPHEDHCDGVAEAIEALQPDYVIAFDSRRRGRRGRVVSYYDHLTSRAVTGAFDAIDQLVPADRQLRVAEGSALPELGVGANVRVMAPDASRLGTVLETGLPSRANEASIVFEIVYGHTRVVLGADLPAWRTEEPHSAVATGWLTVLDRYPDLRTHAALKVPHHGSRWALSDLLLEGVSPRAWVVTPYNSSGLPRPEDGEGLDVLLAREPAVLLSALVAGRERQLSHPPPGRVTRQQLQEHREEGEDSFLRGGRDIRRLHELEPLDPLWCVAVDDAGAVVGAWRGRAAVEVVEDSEAAGRSADTTSRPRRRGS